MHASSVRTILAALSSGLSFSPRRQRDAVPWAL